MSTLNTQTIAKETRRAVLGMIHDAQTSHIGSNLSCIDLMTVLFEKFLNLNGALNEDRDRFILSKGWAAATLYHFLARKGVIPAEDIATYCKPGSKYIGLAEPYVRGVEFAGGSMGHGLPAAVGMALAAKRTGAKWKTYVLMSDGELDCGTTWESALIAAHQKLDNLRLIIDYNKFQAIGRTNEVLNLEPLEQKWRAFGWVAETIDGHDHAAIEKALDMAPRDRPVVIIANTVKGKGVSFMEDKLEYHYKNVSDEEYALAMREL